MARSGRAFGEMLLRCGALSGRADRELKIVARLAKGDSGAALATKLADVARTLPPPMSDSPESGPERLHGRKDDAPASAGTGDDPVTVMLHAAARGDKQAAADLLPLVYDHLRALAGMKMASERKDHTLAPTALVSEAYMKLVRDPDLRWNDRVHFFNAAAQAMRRILVDHARSKGARRRALDARRAMTSLSDLVVSDDSAGILSLDAALARLEEVDATASQVVRLRFFAGLSVVETAEALGVSERTVMREWAFARAWLLDALRAEESEDDSER